MAISKNGNVITLNSSGDLINTKSDNGRIFWNLNTIGSLFAHDTDFFTSSDIVIVGNDIIFSTSSSIFSIDLKSGYLNWKQDIGSKNNPIIDGNNVFLISDNGYFVNLDKKSGKIIWSINIQGFYLPLPKSIHLHKYLDKILLYGLAQSNFFSVLILSLKLYIFKIAFVIVASFIGNTSKLPKYES